MFPIAAFFLLISGIAALTYQVAWVRLLGLSMGSTAAAISTVLAAFFLGLALGSYLAERITRNRIHNLKPYILLEVLIGISGLLLLPTLLNLDALMAMLPVWGTSLAMKFAISIFLLIIPTLCMGATFPVMAGIMIRRQGEMGLRMSQLYSLNTTGAVLGACLSGFVFIPAFGLDGAIYIAVALNVLIVFMAWRVNRRLVLPPVETGFQHVLIDEQRYHAPLQGRALVVLFFTGLVAIATEVGWTKYLVIFAGTTIYGFASILTIFLIGIAAGSWAIRHTVERIRVPQTWMAVGLVLLGLSLLLTRAGLSAIPSIYQAVNHLPAPDLIVHLVKYSFVFTLLFVPTFLFGALFPINLKLYCGDLEGVRSRIGKAYAVNTVASIFGSLLAGFWLIPAYGTDLLLSVMAGLILLLPMIFLPAIADRRMRLVIAGVTLAVIGSHWLLPHLDYKDLIASVGYDNESKRGSKPEFLYLQEGKAGVVSMVSYDDNLIRLQNNGLNESFLDKDDPYNMLIAETLLGLVPYFYHENPKSAFVVGFGGGITTRSLSFSSLASIRVVELEPAVVAAGRAIAGGEIPVLQDPRVQLSFNDARNTLLVEDQAYDIIVAQPSHPWRAGAANVFTRQFFQVVDARLNTGGIFGQWINLFHMDVTTLKALIKAFLDVFPEVVSYANLDTGDLLLFGSHARLVFDADRINARMQLPDIKKALAHHDVHSADELFWYFGLSRAELQTASAGSVANTDTNILSEVRLSKLIAEPSGAENPYDFLRAQFHLDILPYLEGQGVAERLYRIGEYFIGWDDVEMARKVAVQLEGQDARGARSLRYLTLARQFRLPEATEFYEQHEDWLDRVHLVQLQVYVEFGAWPAAQKVLSRIKDKSLWRGANAYLLYEQGQWKKLAALHPSSDLERQWYLAGEARHNLVTAGKQLARLVNDQTDAPHLLRTMIRYFAEIGDTAGMDKMARQLVTIQNNLYERMVAAGNKAIAAQELSHAEYLIERIQRLYPDADKLQAMEDGLEQARERQHASMVVAQPASESVKIP